MMDAEAGQRVSRPPLGRSRVWLGADPRLVGLSFVMTVVVGVLVTQGFGVLYGLPVGVVMLVAGVRIARVVFKINPRAFDVWRAAVQKGRR